jgi:hypothetical protein
MDSDFWSLKWVLVIGVIGAIVALVILLLYQWILPYYVWKDNSSNQSSESKDTGDIVTGTIDITWLTKGFNLAGTESGQASFIHNLTSKETTLTIEQVDIIAKSGSNGVIGFFCKPNSVPKFIIPNTLSFASDQFPVDGMITNFFYSIDQFGALRCESVGAGNFFNENVSYTFPKTSFTFTSVTTPPTLLVQNFTTFMNSTILNTPVIADMTLVKNEETKEVGLYSETINFETNSIAGNFIISSSLLPQAFLPVFVQSFSYQTSNGAINGLQSSKPATITADPGGSVILEIANLQGDFDINNVNCGFCLFYPYQPNNVVWPTQ